MSMFDFNKYKIKEHLKREDLIQWIENYDSDKLNRYEFWLEIILELKDLVKKNKTKFDIDYFIQKSLDIDEIPNLYYRDNKADLLKWNIYKFLLENNYKWRFDNVIDVKKEKKSSFLILIYDLLNNDKEFINELEELFENNKEIISNNFQKLFNNTFEILLYFKWKFISHCLSKHENYRYLIVWFLTWIEEYHHLFDNKEIFILKDVLKDLTKKDISYEQIKKLVNFRTYYWDVNEKDHDELVFMINEKSIELFWKWVWSYSYKKLKTDILWYQTYKNLYKYIWKESSILNFHFINRLNNERSKILMRNFIENIDELKFEDIQLISKIKINSEEKIDSSILINFDKEEEIILNFLNKEWNEYQNFSDMNLIVEEFKWRIIDFLERKFSKTVIDSIELF